MHLKPGGLGGFSFLNSQRFKETGAGNLDGVSFLRFTQDLAGIRDLVNESDFRVAFSITLFRSSGSLMPSYPARKPAGSSHSPSARRPTSLTKTHQLELGVNVGLQRSGILDDENVALASRDPSAIVSVSPVRLTSIERPQCQIPETRAIPVQDAGSACPILRLHGPPECARSFGVGKGREDVTRQSVDLPNITDDGTLTKELRFRTQAERLGLSGERNRAQPASATKQLRKGTLYKLSPASETFGSIVCGCYPGGHF